MQFDRSKFKKQDLSEIEQMTKEAQSTMVNQFSNNGYIPYYSLEMGRNVLRVLPAIDGKVYVPLKVAKLAVEVPVYDKEGNVTGKEVKDKNVFCADVHGQTILQGKCPIATYIKHVFKLAEEIQDNDERQKFLSPVTGYSSKKGWIWGINPMLNFVCYVTVSDKIHKFQLRKQWLDKLKELSIERSEESALSVDIFSGIEDGYPLIINIEEKIEETKTGKKKKKTVYSLSTGLPRANEEWKDFFAENTIPESVLEELASIPMLSENFINSYKKRDFEMALDGLERFDKENNYGVFSNDQFLDELEQMANLIPEDEEEGKSTSTTTTKPIVQKSVETKKTPTKVSPTTSAAIENVKKYPPLIKLKAFLKDYIDTEYEGTEELPDLNIAELREWYDLAKAGEMLPFEVYKTNDVSTDIPFDGDSGTLGQEDGDDENSDESPIEENEVLKGDAAAAAMKKVQSLRAKFAKK